MEGEAASYFSPVVPPCLVADAPGASRSVSKASESHNETLRKKIKKQNPSRRQGAIAFASLEFCFDEKKGVVGGVGAVQQ